MMGLVQIFGSSPALLVVSQAFLVFTIFPPPPPQRLDPSPLQQARKTLEHQLMRHREGFGPFGTRWVEQLYFCSFKMLNGFLLFKAKTISTLLVHLFLPWG